jgi:hypothetical protein
MPDSWQLAIDARGKCPMNRISALRELETVPRHISPKLVDTCRITEEYASSVNNGLM